MTSPLSKNIVLAIFFGCLFFLSSQVSVHAQSNVELKETVRNSLLSDPRAVGISKTDLDLMVDILTQEAQKQGMTSRDIQWRPNAFVNTVPGTTRQEDPCLGMPSYFCAVNKSFGFAGDDWSVALGLGISSGLLLLILGALLRRHHHAHVPEGVSPAPHI